MTEKDIFGKKIPQQPQKPTSFWMQLMVVLMSTAIFILLLYLIVWSVRGILGVR